LRKERRFQFVNLWINDELKTARYDSVFRPVSIPFPLWQRSDGGTHEPVFPLRYFHHWIAVVRRIAGLSSQVAHDDPNAVALSDTSWCRRFVAGAKQKR
jgi:hypothetical protein